MQKKLNIQRSLGAALALFFFLAIIGYLLYLLIANLINELVQLSALLSAFSPNLDIWNISKLTDRLTNLLINLHVPASFVQDTLNNYWHGLDILKNFISISLSGLFSVVTSLPNYFVLFMITIVASFFIARDYRMIVNNILSRVPDKWRPSALRVFSGLRRALFGYIKAELILLSITGLLSLIGLTIMGVHYAHLVALVAAMADLVPIVGTGAIYIPWSIWMFFSGDIKLGIGLLILYGIIVVMRQMMEPKVVGNNIGLQPLTTLISLYLGLELLGVWGLILGPAVMIAYKAFTETEEEE
jgi:sporulation integral membrane protein YtvI